MGFVIVLVFGQIFRHRDELPANLVPLRQNYLRRAWNRLEDFRLLRRILGNGRQHKRTSGEDQSANANCSAHLSSISKPHEGDDSLGEPPCHLRSPLAPSLDEAGCIAEALL